MSIYGRKNHCLVIDVKTKVITLHKEPLRVKILEGACYHLVTTRNGVAIYYNYVIKAPAVMMAT